MFQHVNHLSYTDVKARVNNWQLVHICEHVAASKVASFFTPDLMVAVIVERLALLAVDSEYTLWLYRPEANMPTETTW